MNKTQPKKPFYKNKWFLAITTIIILSAVAGNMNNDTNSSDNTSSKTNVASAPTLSGYPSNYLNTLTLITRPVINGSKTEKIGNFGQINADKNTLINMSLDEFIEFQKSVVALKNNENLNWVLIKFSDNTGLHVILNEFVTYGIVDAANETIETTINNELLSDLTTPEQLFKAPTNP